MLSKCILLVDSRVFPTVVSITAIFKALTTVP